MLSQLLEDGEAKVKDPVDEAATSRVVKLEAAGETGLEEMVSGLLA